MEKEWKNKLRESLEDYSEEVPAGLWDDIRKGMESAGGASRRRNKPAIWFSVAGMVAAAALALFLVPGWKNTSEPISVVAPKEQPEAIAEVVVEKTETEKPVSAQVEKKSEKVVAGPYEETLPYRTPETECDYYEEPSVTSDETSSAVNTVSSEEVADEKTLPEEKGETLPWDVPEENERTANPVSLSLSGAGTGKSNGEKVGYSGFNGSDVAHQFVNGGTDLGIVEYENNNKTVSSTWSHKMPIQVSLNASWRFHPRFRLTSGLTYSLLLSELKSGSDDSYWETKQTLHYLGIPLSVDFSIWRNHRWDFYISAGGMMEKCIAGKTSSRYVGNGQQIDNKTEWMMENPLQWSVKGGAGVQVMLGRIVGLYLEPMATYHFDNGSYVENVYKDRPFNFGLNFGVRLEF